jgi:dolichyl-phosphate beta-glucosyltransferase
MFNEEKRLNYSLNVIKRFTKKKSKKNLEIIFVNDGSTDNTDQILKKFIKQNFKQINIKYLSYNHNKGKGFAVKTGVLASKNTWILTCDTDMSVLPSQLDLWIKNNLIKKNDKAYYGSRVHKDSIIKALFLRKLFGNILNVLLTILFKIELSDTQCGFKIFNSKYAKKIFKKLKCFGYAYDIEITLLLKKNKIQVVELPLKWEHRSGSKVNLLKDSIKIFYDLLILKLR